MEKINNEINEMRKMMNLNEVSLRLPQKPTLTDSEKQEISSISSNDIDFEQMNNTSPIQLKVITPLGDKITNAIIFDIQIVGDGKYQPHISIHKDIQSKGLGYKIYKRFIELYGSIYSGIGRRHNNVEIPAILNKLNREPNIECNSDDNGTLCMLKHNNNRT